MNSVRESSVVAENQKSADPATLPPSKEAIAAPHGYRADIDGLRAIAVLSVLGFHLAPGRVTGGFVGVDVFFVISGFLISSIILSELSKGVFTFSRFYIRRARRILPALSLMCTTSMIAGWLFLLPEEYEHLAKQVVAGILFVANFLFWSESSYFDAASELKPMLHLWSLGIEEQFYLAWPFILFLLWHKRCSIPGWILGLAAASFGTCLALADRYQAAAFYLPFARFWQLMAGALLAHVAPLSAPAQPQPVRHFPARHFVEKLLGESTGTKHLRSCIGFSLIAWSVLGVDSRTSYPILRALLPTLGAVLVISAGANGYVNRYLLSRRPMVFIGLLSYPLYLWHWPLLSFVAIVQPPGSVRLWRLGVAVAAFLLALFTYTLAEKRIRRSGSENWKAVTGATALCAAIGAAVIWRSGFSAERGPWGVEGLPTIPEASTMQETRCLARSGQLFAPRVLAKRDFCSAAELGNKSRNTVVVGDSHANRLFLGLREVDRSRSYSNLGRGTCIPFAGFDGRLPETGEGLLCRDTVLNILKNVAQSPSEQVILHGYFLRAYSGIFQPSEAGSLERHASETFAILAKAAKKTIVVLDVPVLTFPPNSCVARPVLKAMARASCSISASGWEQSVGKTNEQIRLAAGRFSNVEVFDPASVLCDADECHGILNGKLLYLDTHHLSQDGAELVARELLNRLEGSSASRAVEHDRSRAPIGLKSSRFRSLAD